jgi:hypothetical protein
MGSTGDLMPAQQAPRLDPALLSDGDGIYDIVLTEISGGSNDTNIFSRESAFPLELIVTIAGDV